MSQSTGAREELKQTAAMLEQILEVMPDDLFTLRALYETSLKLELPEQAFDVLKRLDDGARKANNADSIAFVLNQYASIVDEMPDVQPRMERLRELQMMADLRSSAKPAPPPVVESKGIESEMALAWDLFQDEQLTQDEYSNVLHDLTEMSSRQTNVPVTVLHVLHDRNFNRFDRLMTHLCQKSKAPIVSLSQFDEREDLRELLPLDLISRRGVLPFSRVGDDLLMAVLNPMDRDLVQNASNLTGRRCHIFLVTPDEYDQRLEQIRKALTA